MKRKNPIPVIYGNGVDDDSAGLNALVLGEPVENRSGVRFSKGQWHMPAGTIHTVSQPLCVPPRKQKAIKRKARR